MNNNFDHHLNFITKQLYDKIISNSKYKHLEGKGLFDWIKNTASKVYNKVKDIATGIKNVVTGNKYSYLNNTQRKLNEYGKYRVTKIVVFRTPILKVIDGTLKLISLGKWEQLKGKYGYDAFFHLSCLMTLETGKQLYIEKNANIEITDNYSTNPETETLNVSTEGKIIFFGKMFELGRKNVGDQNWFIYDGFANNCQDFILALLGSYNLVTNSVYDFIKQDMGELINELPSYVINISKKVTDLGGIFQKLIGGKKKIILQKSNDPDKRFMVKIGDKTIHFGDKSGSTYIDHKNDELKDAYIARHKVNENWNDINSAGFWSRWLLWEKPILTEAINDIEKRFDIDIVNENNYIGGLNPLVGRIGGKKLLKKKIVDKYFPKKYEEMIYVEPFVGGGSIFFYKEPSKKEIINDKDKNLIEIYRGFKKFDGNKISKSINGKYTKMDYEKIKKLKPTSDYNNFIKNLLMYKLSFYSQQKSFGGDTKISTNYDDKYFDRLKDAIILNQDYKSIIHKYDSDTTFFYLDPPYEKSEGLYEHSDLPIEDLFDILSKIKGKFLLSYNDSSRVKDLFKNYNIINIKTKYTNPTEGGQSIKKNELLISNYKL